MEKEDYRNLIKNIERDLKSSLGEKRYNHTKGVEAIAADLGVYYNENVEKLKIAALLHDSGKYIDRDRQACFVKENGIDAAEEDLKAPGIIHALISRHIAYYKYGIRDQSILDAVKYHTTGRPGMSVFEKIIFVSDYLDPGRGFAEQAAMLEKARNDLNGSVLDVCKSKIIFVIEKGKYLHPLSVGFYNEMILKGL